MTNEETKVVLKSLADNPLLSAEHITKALYKAIELVESQPCEDAVSRESLDIAISNLTYWHFENDRLVTGGGGSKVETVYKVDDVWRLTHVLPPVTPSRPKGKWIPIHPLQEDDDGEYICSNCEQGDWDCDTIYKYCPYCGADMRG